MLEKKPSDGWASAARKLWDAAKDPGLHPEVLGQLKSSHPPRVLVACSGGADSVFLLCLLWVWAKENTGFSIEVAHYNHRWRGRASDQDEAFVSELAAELGCRFHSERCSENKVEFTETSARALRLNFLWKVARARNCRWIAFGHQNDDILETLLLRIGRGSGTEGLAAPRPVHRFDDGPVHIRPFLHVSAAQVRELLEKCGMPWCEDDSNTDRSIARNALRWEVIPALENALKRDVRAGAGRARRLLEEDAEALVVCARQYFPEAFAGAASLERARLRDAPKALARRALRAWLDAAGILPSFSAQALDALVETARSDKKSGRISAGRAFVVLEPTCLSLAPEADEEFPGTPLQAVDLSVGERIVLSTGAVMEAQAILLEEAERTAVLRGDVDPARQAYLAWEQEQGDRLYVRSWQAGDRFCPIGAPGSKKLHDWFIDRRVPAGERKHRPVVTNGEGQIIWVPGLPPKDSLKIGRETTRALRLTYRI
ncbi:MAG: tRNA lysidine(34) synthetase TilS [Opitutales bacterium]